MLRKTIITSTLFSSLVLCGGCDEGKKEVTPQPDPSSKLACELTQVTPRTFEIEVSAALMLEAQCSFEGEVGGAREAALAATLAVAGSTIQVNEVLFDDAGMLRMAATVVVEAMPGATAARAITIADELGDSLATGRLFAHMSETDMIAKHGEPADECFQLCGDDAGTYSEEYFEGARCECAAPTLMGTEGVPLEVYLWAGPESIELVQLNRTNATSPRSTLSVVVPGLDPATLVHQEHSLILDGLGGNPHILWWGTAAGSLWAVKVPLVTDGFGAAVVLNTDAVQPAPVFVTAMELHQSDTQTELPQPVFLYAYQETDVTLGWGLTRLFHGTGTEAASLATLPLWGLVAPEDVQEGSAAAGMIRTGVGSLDPRQGVNSVAEFRAWAVRPDPDDPSLMHLSIMLDGMAIESQTTMPAPTGDACWRIESARDGYVVSHRAIVAQPFGDSGGGGIYYASAVGEQLGLAPLYDFVGENLYANAETRECLVATPKTWQTNPIEGSIWTTTSSLSRRKRGRIVRTWQTILSPDTSPPGGETPLSPAHVMPLLVGGEEMPNEGGPSLRAQVSVNASHVALTHELSSGLCSAEKPCVSMQQMGAEDNTGIGWLYPGTEQARFGFVERAVALPASWPDSYLADVNEDVAPVVLNTDDSKMLVLLDLASNGLGVIHYESDGTHQGHHALGLTGDAGPVVHTMFAEQGAAVFVRASAQGALSLERADEAAMTELASGAVATLATTPLGTLSQPKPEGSSFNSWTATAAASGTASLLPSGQSIVSGHLQTKWMTVFIVGDASGCTSPDILIADDQDALTQLSLDASSGLSCEDMSGAIVGDFLGTGGKQILTKKIVGTTLELHLLWLRADGLAQKKYGEYPLPDGSNVAEMTSADLDGDGLVDVIVDIGLADGVLIGLSDGLGSTSDGLQVISGISSGISLANASFGKGTKSSTTPASAKPELL